MTQSEHIVWNLKLCGMCKFLETYYNVSQTGTAAIYTEKKPAHIMINKETCMFVSIVTCMRFVRVTYSNI